MQLKIAHRSTYTYTEPARYSIQYLRLTPQTHTHQQVIRWRVSGPGSMSSFTDGFGNAVQVLVVSKPHKTIDIDVAGDVITRETHGVTPPGAEPFPPIFYLRETQLTEPDDEIRDFAEEHRDKMKKGHLECLHDLMRDLHERVAYEGGATTVVTTASEAFAVGRGVCQDHAHVFLACCRILDIPARYISGYLCADVQEGAMHAWAEALVPDLGWVGFDPANCLSPHEGYVRLAVGLDYRDAAPVRGVRSGGGGEELAVQVQVDDESTQQQSQSQGAPKTQSRVASRTQSRGSREP